MVFLYTVSAHLRFNPQVFLRGQYPAVLLHPPVQEETGLLQHLDRVSDAERTAL